MPENAIWSFDFTGRVSTLGGKKIKMEKQLTEALDIRMAQRHVIMLARYLDNNQPITVKMRIQYVQNYLHQSLSFTNIPD